LIFLSAEGVGNPVSKSGVELYSKGDEYGAFESRNE